MGVGQKLRFEPAVGFSRELTVPAFLGQLDHTELADQGGLDHRDRRYTAVKDRKLGRCSVQGVLTENRGVAKYQLFREQLSFRVGRRPSAPGGGFPNPCAVRRAEFSASTALFVWRLRWAATVAAAAPLAPMASSPCRTSNAASGKCKNGFAGDTGNTQAVMFQVGLQVLSQLGDIARQTMRNMAVEPCRKFGLAFAQAVYTSRLLRGMRLGVPHADEGVVLDCDW